MRIPPIICAAVVALSVPANGHETLYLDAAPLAANTLIKIISFGIDTQTYCVYPPHRGGVFVTVAALVTAVPSLSTDKVLENPSGLLGKEFTTGKELTTVMGDTVEAEHSCTPG